MVSFMLCECHLNKHNYLELSGRWEDGREGKRSVFPYFCHSGLSYLFQKMF